MLRQIGFSLILQLLFLCTFFTEQVDAGCDSFGCSNDLCGDAEVLDFGVDTIGDTTYATTDMENLVDLSLCEGVMPNWVVGAPPSAAGVWYMFNGTGTKVEASLCGSSYDTQMNVYEADPFWGCDDLYCIGTNDDASEPGCNIGSKFVWATQFNMTYWILVHGYQNSVGQYTLRLEELESPANDDCANAVEVSPGDFYQADTANAMPVDLPSCFDNISGYEYYGLWYKITGTGNLMEINTCDGKIFFNTQMFLFTGPVEIISATDVDSSCATVLDCTSITSDPCSDDHGKTLIWESEVDTMYYILVTGNYNVDAMHTAIDGGFFTLSVYEEEIDLTNQQTQFPLMNPENDFCFDAVIIAPGSSEYGSTIYASLDEIPACDADFNIFNDGINGTADYTAGILPVYNSTAPGVWYSVQGTGNGIVASLCGSMFDTKLTLFVGEDGGCDILQCLDTNDDSFCGTQSEISWLSEINTTYYLLVHGFDVEMGDFVLSLEDAPELTLADTCLNATVATLGATVSGSTDGARESFIPSCDSWVPEPIPVIVPDPADGSSLMISMSGDFAVGVWYKIFGTGNMMVADLCGSEFDTKIAILTGDACDALSCVADNDDSSYCGLQSEVMWNSTPGATYYIFVHGFGMITGDYTLYIDEMFYIEPEVEENSEQQTGDGYDDDLFIPDGNDPSLIHPVVSSAAGCVNGLHLEVGANPITDSTTPSVPELWYSINGTGGNLVASLCGSTFDTQITIHIGSCDAPMIVNSNDDSLNCGLQSEVIFETEPDITYLILVHGYGDSVGTFTLFVEEMAPPINDRCEDNILLELGPNQAVEASTDYATPELDPLPCHDTSTVTSNTTLNNSGVDSFISTEGRGVWYSIVGTGETLRASLCGSSFDTQIDIYEGGSCDTLSCVATNDDSCGTASRIEWESAVNALYYVFVHGFGTSTGSFSLSVQEFTN